MRGLNGPSELKGCRYQLTDGQAWAEGLTGEPLHSSTPAPRSCALFSQSWCCGGIPGNGRFGKPSLRSQTHLDPD